MFSLFPSLFAFEGFAPFFLRITLGIIFIYWAYPKLKDHNNSKEMTLGILESIIGLFLIFGLMTQLIAIISTIIFAVYLIKKIKEKAFLTNGVNYYFILFIISLTLIFTGAGLFAIDLPL